MLFSYSWEKLLVRSGRRMYLPLVSKKRRPRKSFINFKDLSFRNWMSFCSDTCEQTYFYTYASTSKKRAYIDCNFIWVKFLFREKVSQFFFKNLEMFPFIYSCEFFFYLFRKKKDSTEFPKILFELIFSTNKQLESPWDYLNHKSLKFSHYLFYKVEVYLFAK